MRKLFLSLLMLAGCAHPSEIRVRLFTPLNTSASSEEGAAYQPVVEEGAAILGYEVRFVTRVRGAITLDLQESESGDVLGRAILTTGCYRAAWAIQDPWVIAHELGHTLGLEHSDDSDNLMRPSKQRREDAELSPHQQNVMDRHAAHLMRCRGN